jgi:1,4-alpha-glucan branching enzyme
VTIEVHDCRCGEEGQTLLVRATEASSIEVVGDFTDWEPVALSPAEASSWRVTLPLPPGTYRFNIRIDGGAWLVPAGMTSLIDEFGGVVGLLTVRSRR